MFDAGKKIIGLQYREKNYDNMLSGCPLIPERHRQTDKETDRHNCYINTARQCAYAR